MADEVLSLEARFVDGVSKGLKEAEGKFRDLADNAKQSMGGISGFVGQAKEGIVKFAKAFGPAAIVVGALTLAKRKLAEAIAFVDRVATEFEKTMSSLLAILRPTATEFSALSDQARELGRTTTFSASEAGQAFVELGKMGMRAGQIIQASTGVLNLAAVAQTDMATSARAVSEVLNQFGLQATQSTRVVDIMAKSFTASALDLQKFNDAMSYAGVIAGQLDIPIERTSAALAILADHGIAGSMAGTGLRFTMSQLYQETSKIGQRIGVTADDTRTFGERLEAVRELGLTTGEMMEIFGQRAGVAAAVLVNNTEALDEMTESLENSRGTAKEMADTMLDNVAGSTKLLQSAQEGLGIAIGEAFAGDKQARIEMYAKAISRATQWVRAHHEELKAVSKIVTGLLTILWGLGTSIVKIIATAVGTVQLLIGSIPEFWLSVTSMVMNSINRVSKFLTGKDVIDTTGIENQLHAFQWSNQRTVDNIVAVWNKNANFTEPARVQLEQTTESVKKMNTNLGDGKPVKTIEQLIAALTSRIRVLNEAIKETNQALQDNNKSISLYVDSIERIKLAVADFSHLLKQESISRFASDIELLTINNERELEILDAKHEKERERYKEHEEALTAVKAAQELERSALIMQQEKLRKETIKRNAVEGAKIVTGALMEMTKENKKYMALYKTAALAQAVMDTYAGAIAAYKSMAGIPIVGPALGAVAAGVVTVAGIANMAKISSAKFARGGDFVTSGERTITVGDNPGGKERVTITPLSSRNFDGAQASSVSIGGSNITINGNVGQREVQQIDNSLFQHRRQIERLFRSNHINPARLGLARAGAV